jgi:hypothetical protein
VRIRQRLVFNLRNVPAQLRTRKQKSDINDTAPGPGSGCFALRLDRYPPGAGRNAAPRAC